MKVPFVDLNDPADIANAIASLRDGCMLLTRGSTSGSLMLLLAAILEIGVRMDKGEWVKQVQSALDHGKANFSTLNVH